MFAASGGECDPKRFKTIISNAISGCVAPGEHINVAEHLLQLDADYEYANAALTETYRQQSDEGRAAIDAFLEALTGDDFDGLSLEAR